MKSYLFTILSALLLFGSASFANDTAVLGLWQTESTDKGYLHVSIEVCDSALCGVIVAAYNLQDEADPNYEHLGKNMVWGMKSKGISSWSKGKIWDPSKDKTYKSKMSLNDDTLSVSGCIVFVCRGQDWSRVKK
ncbi:MAG: DUF2147 domain-containing protein [Granulosicoccus sp.]